jgi:hypothetical protein
MPTAFNLEEITGVDNETKEEDLDLIPLKSRFIAALRRIAFCIVSSSVVEDPSSATACLVLRLSIGAHDTESGSGDGEEDLAEVDGVDDEEACAGDVIGV